MELACPEFIEEVEGLVSLFSHNRAACIAEVELILVFLAGSTKELS